MSLQPPPAWTPEQSQRLEQFDLPRCVDIHCHLLPGLDDGPADLDESVKLARALAADGITTVCATPHQLGRYDRMNSAEVVDGKTAELLTKLAEHAIPLEILPGGDIRIDERIPRLLDSGELVTLAGAGRHLLLELPHELYVDPLPTIEILAERGLQTILTHPERHRYLAGSERRLREWVAAGAVIQLTAGSLLGEFGNQAFHEAWRILKLGLAGVVATDAHDCRRRPPRLTEALAALEREVGLTTAGELCLRNPYRVLTGEPIPMVN